MNTLRRDVYQAIADPVRRDIIEMIAQQPMNLNSIAGQFDISRPAISKHIKILAECGLVEIRQDGRERFCHVQPAPLKEVAGWIGQFQRQWEERLDKFEAYLQTLKQPESDQED